MPTSPSKTFETFPNPSPDRDYIIEIESPEFTCLCPKTGQPDFATLILEYIPDRLCVELKSLKLYIWSFRNEGHFHEKVTNTILNDLVAAIEPRYMRLRAYFNVRGGIYTTVTVEHRKPGWQPPPPPPPGLSRTRRRAAGRTTDTPPSADPVDPEPSEPSREARGRSDATPPHSTARRSEPIEPETPARSAADLSANPPPSRPATPAPTANPAATGSAPSPEVTIARAERMLQRSRAGTRSTSTSATPARPPAAAASRDIYIGLDLGTSGCRAMAIDRDQKVLAQGEAALPPPLKFEGQVTQDPNDWWRAATTALKTVLAKIDVQRVHRIAVAGTSGTLLLCDKQGNPVTPALMYNDRRAVAEAERIVAVADERTAAHDTSGSLAKLLWLHNNKAQGRPVLALHQADWIGNRLAGKYGHSDYHNCLKLGYDPAARDWPAWFSALDIAEETLPEVHEPGEVIGTLGAEAAALGLPAHVEVVAGTTDGVAAFLASGASKPGHGVTVLGNTLMIKLLSETPIIARANGVYSHRLGRYWLTGGASNAGGAVLMQYFTVDQIREMTPLLDPDTPTELNYYPLPDIGERFPFNDPRMEPKLEPLPGDSTMFLQGILEGIATIEAQAYAVLNDLGAPKATAIWTTGSGSQNEAWTRIRERALGMRLKPARSHHPAYGAALLAAGVLQKAFA
ncbi:MAG: preQ(1) synthase [Sulfurifustis sp.]